MALYYFHLADGLHALIDPEGREVGQTSELAGLALHEARAMISHDVLRGRINLDQFIEVRDVLGTSCTACRSATPSPSPAAVRPR